MSFNFEDIAYWYFRLNGFFTIQNFVVHDKSNPRQLTEIDVLGFRFSNRQELYPSPMQDDQPWISSSLNTIVIADSKRATGNSPIGCKINNSLLKRENESIESILYATGCCCTESVAAVAEELYSNQIYEKGDLRVVFVGLADRESEQFRVKYPNVKQLTWEQILDFIYDRFRKYSDLKKDHTQWDEVGKELWDLVQTRAKEQFVKDILKREPLLNV